MSRVEPHPERQKVGNLVGECFKFFQEIQPQIKSLQTRIEPVGFIGGMKAISEQTKFWGALQTELITYFAQHPEESL